MATSDAKMPDHKSFTEDLEEITEHLARLRSEIQGLAGAIGATGSHQAEALQAEAREALGREWAELEDAVRREPVKALTIAAGLGMLVGLVLAR